MNKLVLATIIAVAVPALPVMAQQNPAQQNPAQQNGSSSHVNQPQAQSQPKVQQASAVNPGRDEIRQAQQALDQKGFKAGRADGIMGALTKQALQDFQSQQKLTANGELDQQTLAALGVASNQSSGQSGPASTVGQGSSGSGKGGSNTGSSPTKPNQSH